jgi:hypothetical protein
MRLPWLASCGRPLILHVVASESNDCIIKCFTTGFKRHIKWGKTFNRIQELPPAVSNPSRHSLGYRAVVLLGRDQGTPSSAKVG